jgi:hypothetical protein
VFVGKEQKFMYVPKVSALKTQHVIKIGKTLRACLFGLSVAGCAGKAAVWRKLLCRESCYSEF